MKDNSSHKIKFNDLKVNSITNNSVVIIGGDFWKINKISSDNTFNVSKNTRGGDKWIYDLMTIHLHPNGKGVINQREGEMPFFIYDTKRIRKDVPKELLKGSNFDEIDTTSLNGLLGSNLIGHIVQDSKNSKDGGFVVFDSGSKVIVKLKSGEYKAYFKINLFFKKNSYTKNNYKVLWFYNDTKNKLPINSDKNYIVKDNPYKEYLELLPKVEPHAERSDDFKVWKSNNELSKRMSKLWEKLSPVQKRKIEKLKNKFK